MSTDARAGNRVIFLIGLLIALGLPFAHLSAIGKAYGGLGPLWGGEVLWWLLGLAIQLYVLFVERRPLATLGFHAIKGREIALGFLAAFVIIAGDVAVSSVLAALHVSTAVPKLAGLFQAPLWFRLLVVARAPIVEEIAFRGYGFERIVTLTGSRWLAAFVTFALFTYAHYTGGGIALAAAAACGGLVLTALYLWRRNLWTNILAHWLVDFVGLILVPMLSAHH